MIALWGRISMANLPSQHSFLFTNEDLFYLLRAVPSLSLWRCDDQDLINLNYNSTLCVSVKSKGLRVIMKGLCGCKNFHRVRGASATRVHCPTGTRRRHSRRVKNPASNINSIEHRTLFSVFQLDRIKMVGVSTMTKHRI